MRTGHPLAAVLLVFMFTVLGCQVPTASKAKAALQPGMTESQVVSLLGKPRQVIDNNGKRTYLYRYSQSTGAAFWLSGPWWGDTGKAR
jgi:outer membrane protein assembly factor BamE (lipoprotein component of BamABCDE complex)